MSKLLLPILCCILCSSCKTYYLVSSSNVIEYKVYDNPNVDDVNYVSPSDYFIVLKKPTKGVYEIKYGNFYGYLTQPNKVLLDRTIIIPLREIARKAYDKRYQPYFSTYRARSQEIKRQRINMVQGLQIPLQPSGTYRSTSTPTYSGGEVRVRGYYRKDGTYVRPHTRSAPTRRH